MTNNSYDENILEMIGILNIIKDTVNPETRLTWTAYNTPQEIIEELDQHIAGLKNGNLETIEELRVNFLPTCD